MTPSPSQTDTRILDEAARAIKAADGWRALYRQIALWHLNGQPDQLAPDECATCGPIFSDVRSEYRRLLSEQRESP